MKNPVWVVNKDREDYTEAYNGDIVRIPANGKIKMSRHDATRFLGQFGGSYEAPHLMAGQMKTKNLVIEKIGDETEESKFVSNLDGKEFTTQAELDSHLKKFEHRNVTKDDIAREVARRG